MGTASITVRQFPGSLASLNLGNITDRTVLDDLNAPRGGRVNSSDSSLGQVDSGVATFTPEGGTEQTLTYIGSGTISLLGVLDIEMDTVDIGIFTAGRQVFLYLPEGLPDLPYDTFRIDIDAKMPMALPDLVTCFGDGTRILTRRGEVPIEQIEPGEIVIDGDGRGHRVLWVGRRTVNLPALCASQFAKLVPVRIRKGALGPQMPKTDTLLSQQHRVLMRDPHIEALFGMACGFVAAKSLVGTFAEYAAELDTVTYHHILCAEHVTLVANGIEAESLFLGDLVMNGIHPEQRAEILAILPELAGPAWLDSMRLCHPALRNYEARMLTSRGDRADRSWSLVYDER